MRYSELIKQLKKSGCLVYREGRNHTQWINPKTGKVFSVSRHHSEEVPIGTLKSIKKDAGLK